jgi:hypothetical protein
MYIMYSLYCIILMYCTYFDSSFLHGRTLRGEMGALLP